MVIAERAGRSLRDEERKRGDILSINKEGERERKKERWRKRERERERDREREIER